MPKIFQVITTLVFLVFIILFGSGLSCEMIPGQNAENPPPTPPPSPPAEEPAPDDLDDADVEWQTYREPQNLFSIQVPSRFTLISETQSGVRREVTLEVPESCPEELEIGYCFPESIRIKYLYNQGGLTAEEWFSEAGEYFDITGHQEIAGYDALVAIPRETEWYATRYVLTAGNELPNGSRQYIFDFWVSSGVEEALSDQILNTFEML